VPREHPLLNVNSAWTNEQASLCRNWIASCLHRRPEGLQRHHAERHAAHRPASYTAGSPQSATTDDDNIGDMSSQEQSAKKARRVSAQGKRPTPPLEALPEPKLLHGGQLTNEEHKLERSPEPLDLRVCISQGRKHGRPDYSSNQSDHLGPCEEQNILAAVRMAAMRSATTRTAIRAVCIDKCVVHMPQGDNDPSDGQSSSSCRRRSALSTSFEQSIQSFCMMCSELLLRCQARCDSSDWTVKEAAAPCQLRCSAQSMKRAAFGCGTTRAVMQFKPRCAPFVLDPIPQYGNAKWS
jgi:hypothetical protein